MVRAVSLLTLPVRVTMPPATEALMSWALRLGSEESRCCTWELRLASSVAGALLLQPARVRAAQSRKACVRPAVRMV